MQLDGGHIYDTWTLNPVRVTCNASPYQRDRKISVDRRLPDWQRAGPGDFDETKYVPGFLHPHETALSYASPMTQKTLEQFLGFWDRVTAMKAKAQMACGPVWFPKRKVLRLQDDTKGPMLPHSIWMTALAEYPQRVRAWAVLIPNTNNPINYEGCLVSVRHVEKLVGYPLWQHIQDDGFIHSKTKIQNAWW